MLAWETQICLQNLIKNELIITYGAHPDIFLLDPCVPR